jgi:hypothetical protein
MLKRFPRGRINFKTTSQSVTITGFGEASFDSVWPAIVDLQETFIREIGEESLETLQSVQWEGHRALEFDNYIFSLTKYTSVDDNHIPFSTDEDPSGRLENEHGSKLKRTEDNVVQFYVREGNNKT